ncbi:MAG: hypothetical protein H6657_27530 [Ardenticatenaceae bacterium]|nr:hypothetical protein [Ardenticatenaceae bacterium]
MNKKAVVFWIIALFLLASCGGGGTTETEAPATTNNSSSSTTSETAETADEAPAADTTEEEAADASSEATTDTSSETEEAMDESGEEAAPAEEAAAPASPFGNRPLSGTDPDTGLIVNPESVNPGDTFIVRGEIISMNLTPTTAPEFLIQSPEGLKFRIRSQDLKETFYEDGDQLQAFQYRNGLLAQATVTLAADASPSDIPTSTDLVLVKDE